MSLTYTIYLLAITIAIPAGIAIYHFKTLPIEAKYIAWLMVVGMVTELLMITLARMEINNLFIIHVYALVEIVILSSYFYSQINTKGIRRIILYFGATLVVFAIWYAATGDNIAEFNSVPRAIECVYFSLLSCWLFYEFATEPEPIDGSNYFFVGAIMFYFSSCFIVFAFNKYVSASKEELVTMVITHSAVNTFCNLLYSVGLWSASKRYYSQV